MAYETGNAQFNGKAGVKKVSEMLPHTFSRH
jgi:hypothetical protein